jgi:hypothetical protein
MDTILSVSFDGNENFKKAISESFESFINLRQSKPAELIGLSCVY